MKIHKISFALLLIFFIPVYGNTWAWPTVGKVITSDFGPRMLNGWQFHYGVDIRASAGTDIYAVEEGEVLAPEDTEVGWPGALGIIAVRHPDGVVSRYLHCSQSFIKKGDYVVVGQIIGKSGITGTTE